MQCGLRLNGDCGGPARVHGGGWVQAIANQHVGSAATVAGDRRHVDVVGVQGRGNLRRRGIEGIDFACDPGKIAPASGAEAGDAPIRDGDDDDAPRIATGQCNRTFQQLAEFAFQFGTVEEFLTQLALLTNVEAEADPQDDSEKMKLSTIHQAKGLEFEVVFVIMLCDGLFPSSRSTESNDGEEEERRLFYVSVTRAKNELYLCYPLIRGGFGQSDSDVYQSPSRFLSEIPKDLINEWNLH